MFIWAHISGICLHEPIYLRYMLISLRNVYKNGLIYVSPTPCHRMHVTLCVYFRGLVGVEYDVRMGHVYLHAHPG